MFKIIFVISIMNLSSLI